MGFKCSFCSKVFTQKSDLMLHETHHAREAFLRAYSQQQQQQQQQKNNNNMSKKTSLTNTSSSSPLPLLNLKCVYCQEVYHDQYSLAEHVQQHHMGKKLLSCHLCDKVFQQPSDLAMHMRIHSGEKPFTCNICNKSFTQLSNLAAHKRIHQSEKPFQCTECLRTFSDSSSLLHHMRVHSGEKPFQCDICFETFSISSNLVMHMHTHSGEKPYRCDFCDKSFSQYAHLGAHLKSHADERLFMCKICGRAFTHASNLSAHMKMHSGEKPLICYICNKLFSEPAHLTVHMHTHTVEISAASIGNVIMSPNANPISSTPNIKGRPPLTMSPSPSHHIHKSQQLPPNPIPAHNHHARAHSASEVNLSSTNHSNHIANDKNPPIAVKNHVRNHSVTGTMPIHSHNEKASKPQTPKPQTEPEVVKKMSQEDMVKIFHEVAVSLWGVNTEDILTDLVVDSS